MKWNTQGTWYQVGIEEELMLVGESGHLMSKAHQLLAQTAPTAHLQHELMQSMIEITTPPINLQDAAMEVRKMRKIARDLACHTGCDIAALGTHPVDQSSDQPITNCKRYRQIAKSLPASREMLVCGLHVHVCIPDADTAVRVQQALSILAPDLIALAANSPYRDGRDTQMSSSRAHALLAMPRTGSSPQYEDWQGYCDQVGRMIEAGQIKDATYIWHDVRLQPRYGTVEVRAFDSQSSWEDTVALAHLVVQIAQMIVAGHPSEAYDRQKAQERRKSAVMGNLLAMHPLLAAACDQLDDQNRKRIEYLHARPEHIWQRQVGPQSVMQQLAQRTTS